MLFSPELAARQNAMLTHLSRWYSNAEVLRTATSVNAELLASSGLIRNGEKAVKILGDGELNRAFKVTAAKFSASAKAKIEQAGGQAIVG